MNVLMNNGAYWLAGLTVVILFLAIMAIGQAIVTIIREKKADATTGKV